MFYEIKSKKQEFTEEETKKYSKYGFTFMPVLTEGTFEIDVCAQIDLFFFKDIFPIMHNLACDITITKDGLLLNN